MEIPFGIKTNAIVFNNIMPLSLGQPGAKKATRDLQRKLDSGKYKWSPVAKDVYGRTIVKEKVK